MIGLVASGKRSIRSGTQYNSLFTAKVEGNEIELLPDGSVYDTLKQMKKIVDKTLPQTKPISSQLKGSSLESTCKNIWQFLYSHVQYKKDNPLREQLRTPARTWRDRKTGVDCDCYSIFISSVLTNLGIPHAYRMAGYKGDFQHVYVIVPKPGKTVSDHSTYYAIDPVVNQFNYEAPFTKKHDQKMSQVTMLSGLGGEECNTKPEILRLRKFIPTQEVIARGGVPTKEFLQANGIQFAPSFDRENDRSVYVVNTPQGLLSVPTVLAPSQAEELKLKVGACASTAAAATDTTTADLLAKAKKFGWWWLAIGAGAWILLTGSDQNEVKSGLDGLDKTSKKKKAYKAISI